MAEDTRKTADEGLKEWHVFAAEPPHVFQENNQRTKNKLKP